MKNLKVLAVALIVLGLSASVWAYRDFEAITVAGTAIGFTSAKIALANDHPQMNWAICVVETAPIRWLVTGNSPTASSGMLVNPGATITLSQPLDLVAFLAIRTTSTSAQLDCTYGDAR
jgi:hypothetical protein